MIISEKQIIDLMVYLERSINCQLTEAGNEHAEILLDKIRSQQSEELKVIE